MMCLFGQAFVGWGLSSFVGCDGSQHYQLPSLLRDSTLLPSLLRDSLHSQTHNPTQKGSTPPQTQIEPRFQQTHPSKQTLITLPSPPHSTPASQSTSSTTSCQSSPLHHSSPSSHASPPPPRSAPPPSADTTVGPRPRRHAVRIRASSYPTTHLLAATGGSSTGTNTTYRHRNCSARGTQLQPCRWIWLLHGRGATGERHWDALSGSGNSMLPLAAGKASKLASSIHSWAWSSIVQNRRSCARIA